MLCTALIYWRVPGSVLYQDLVLVRNQEPFTLGTLLHGLFIDANFYIQFSNLIEMFSIYLVKG